MRKIIFIVLIIIIILGIGYWTYRLISKPENQISNWKNYGNEKYGLKIEYPSNWNKYDSYEGNTVFAGITFSPLKEKQLIEEGGAQFIISPLTLSKKTDREFAELRVKGFRSFNPNLEVELSETYLNDIPAIKAESKKDIIVGVSLNDNEGPEGESIIYWFTKNNARFEIGYIYPVVEKEKYKPIFEHMVSTFMFLK